MLEGLSPRVVFGVLWSEHKAFKIPSCGCCSIFPSDPTFLSLKPLASLHGYHSVTAYQSPYMKCLKPVQQLLTFHQMQHCPNSDLATSSTAPRHRGTNPMPKYCDNTLFTVTPSLAPSAEDVHIHVKRNSKYNKVKRIKCAYNYFKPKHTDARESRGFWKQRGLHSSVSRAL